VKRSSRVIHTPDFPVVKRDETKMNGWGKNKWLTRFSEFYRDFLIARVPESISHKQSYAGLRGCQQFKLQ
jgi:hypothetical protein